jgi:predicted HicB family RNase H-like nuclease
MTPSVLQHKGYAGLVEVDLEAKMLHGRVLGLRDVITFQGSTVGEAEQAFHDSVDDYLEFCKERGEKPEKPYSGKFLLRIAPGLHRELALLAEARKQSLNATVEHLLEEALPMERSDFLYPTSGSVPASLWERWFQRRKPHASFSETMQDIRAYYSARSAKEAESSLAEDMTAELRAQSKRRRHAAKDPAAE